MHNANNLLYICKVVQQIEINIITRSEELPKMAWANFFHSPELFRIVEQTQGQTPYMVVAMTDGKVVAHLLAILRRRGSLIPPYLFTQGRIYGEGEYAEGVNREEVFKLMLEAITHKLRQKLCFYIEFSDLSTKMFAYRHFKANSYFPVHWMEIHNSLHSMHPKERLSAKTISRIENAYASGVVTKSVSDEPEFKAFYKLLRRFFTLKVRRYLPPEQQFEALSKSEHSRLYVTKYRDKVIGGCAVVISENNAYLWYMASRRKTHHHLHPGTQTVWHALEDAYEHGNRHFYFMDVGLPFRKDMRREFILRFGGKSVGTYRWFSFTFKWLNKFISWFYKE